MGCSPPLLVHSVGSSPKQLTLLFHSQGPKITTFTRNMWGCAVCCGSGAGMESSEVSQSPCHPSAEHTPLKHLPLGFRKCSLPKYHREGANMVFSTFILLRYAARGNDKQLFNVMECLAQEGPQSSSHPNLGHLPPPAASHSNLAWPPPGMGQLQLLWAPCSVPCHCLGLKRAAPALPGSRGAAGSAHCCSSSCTPRSHSAFLLQA